MRLLALALVLLALPSARAQGTGAWNVDSEFDFFSYNGLGSIWLTAYQFPDGMTVDDAVLVVGCDPASTNGFEISAWVAPTPFEVPEGFSDEVAMLVRFDRGQILEQTWFLSDAIGVQEAVAYYDENEVLFAGLRQAANLALRVQADPANGVPERTFQFEVGGFSAALAALTCGEAPDVGDGEDAGGMQDAPAPIGTWTFEVADGSRGMLAYPSEGAGAFAIYCGDAGNGIEIDVGPYDLVQGDVYDVAFSSGSNVDFVFLAGTATVGPYAAPQLDGDDVEERLIRFLRGLVDLKITLTPRRAGAAALAFTVPTTGFNEAFATLGCR